MKFHISFIIILALASVSPQAEATRIAEMDAGEVRELLDSRPVRDTSAISLPMAVNAADLLTKVYGAIDAGRSRGDCIADAETLFRMTPQEDQGPLWLDSADGFTLDYAGMSPELSAMANFDGDKLSDFGFFFLFPYASGGRDESNRDQAEFCGALLQELYDMGLDLGNNTITTDLFDVFGDYAGNAVNIRLIDADEKENGGQFILILSVEPDGFSPADSGLADATAAE